MIDTRIYPETRTDQPRPVPHLARFAGQAGGGGPCCARRPC
ncbi:MAG: hypothetical protein ACRDRJ_44750 [Streptosporangiaceae bacterium]